MAEVAVGAIDDDRMMLEATSQWFRDVPGIALTALASTVEEYLHIGGEEDVVLLDLLLGDGSRPADNVARLVQHGYKVLVVSVFAEQDHMIATLRAGAKGYLTKDNDLAALARTIREIADGTHVLGHELAFAISRDRRPDRPQLSAQEQLTVELYARGLTLRAVAVEIHVGFATAKAYLQRAKDKYQAVGRPFSTRTDLQNRLREDRLGPPDDE